MLLTLALKIDQILALFGRPQAVAAHIHNSRCVGPTDFDDAFRATFHYTNRSIPLIVTLQAGVLSLFDPQIRYIVRTRYPLHLLLVFTTMLIYQVKGTKASWIKHGIDPQEDQLRADVPLGVLEPLFGVG